MYGYIYITRNIINGRLYIGKRKGEYCKNYYGSGKILKLAIKQYGKNNFANIMIDTAESETELDNKEKYYIALYKQIFGDLLYNLASGGEGGDTLKYKSPEERQEFVDKMTIINTQRARSEQSRKNIGQKIKQYYLNHPEAKEEHSKKIKAYWTPEKRKEHGDLIRARSKETKQKAADAHCKKCIFSLNGQYKEFNSVKDLMKFLQEEYNWHPDRRTFNKVMALCAKNVPYKCFHSKQSHLNGMIIYREKDKENVSTNRDECSGVGSEISTDSKNEANGKPLE